MKLVLHHPSGTQNLELAPRLVENLRTRFHSRLHSKCDGTCAETRVRVLAKRTIPSKSARVSVQSTTGSRGVRKCGSNAGYTKFRGSVKGTSYPLQSPVYTSACHRVPSRFNWTLHE
jgi:hypothetical protein